MHPLQVTTLDIPPSTAEWTQMRESIAAKLRERIREHDKHLDLAAPEPQSSEAWATVLIGECVWPVVREYRSEREVRLEAAARAYFEWNESEYQGHPEISKHLRAALEPTHD